jgi:GR25 family glycosyltransferase involved in LPS biosynthesis
MNFKELFPLQVVINLDKRPDRLKLCVEEEFPKLEITPIRKPGVLFTQTNNSWWNGAIGCMISHYEILQSALLLNTNVVIFEDDIHFEKNNTLEILNLSCNELNNFNWDMLYGGANILKPFYKVSNHLAKLSHAQSTIFYAVNKNFLEKLLNYIDLQKINSPIDIIFADKVIPNHNCYITIPMLATQRTDFSDIEQKIVSYNDYLERRYLENFRNE